MRKGCPPYSRPIETCMFECFFFSQFQMVKPFEGTKDSRIGSRYQGVIMRSLKSFGTTGLHWEDNANTIRPGLQLDIRPNRTLFLGSALGETFSATWDTRSGKWFSMVWFLSVLSCRPASRPELLAARHGVTSELGEGGHWESAITPGCPAVEKRKRGYWSAGDT